MPKRKQRIVRNLPADVAEALERERKRKGASLNQTVVDTLRRGLGLEQQRKSTVWRDSLERGARKNSRNSRKRSENLSRSTKNAGVEPVRPRQIGRAHV